MALASSTLVDGWQLPAVYGKWYVGSWTILDAVSGQRYAGGGTTLGGEVRQCGPTTLGDRRL